MTRRASLRPSATSGPACTPSAGLTRLATTAARTPSSASSPSRWSPDVDASYHAGARELQDRFDTRRLADRLDERFLSRRVIGDVDRAFIERADHFFLATADGDGQPQCSYKGGDPGFVRVLDERTIAFPNYDGNGMYLSIGNVLENPNVGMLFVDFVSARPSRLRVNGIASID